MLVVTEGIFRGPRSCPRHNTWGCLSGMAGLGSLGSGELWEAGARALRVAGGGRWVNISLGFCSL